MAIPKAQPKPASKLPGGGHRASTASAAARAASSKKKSKLTLPKQTEVIVALDLPTPEKAMAMIQQLAGLPIILKVGSELFLSAGPQWVKDRVSEGHRIFLDLKFHDIPNTVAKAAAQAMEMGVEMFTLHLAGGPKMLRTVCEELEKGKGRKPLILGVSVLTSFDQETWAEVAFAVGGGRPNISESVKRLVEQARFWGADGVVCSPHELKNVSTLDPLLYTVIPGIRPKGAKARDQARVMTPADAARLRAKAIVVGRPITEAKNPREACEKILKEVADVFITPARTKSS